MPGLVLGPLDLGSRSGSKYRFRPGPGPHTMAIIKDELNSFGPLRGMAREGGRGPGLDTCGDPNTQWKALRAIKIWLSIPFPYSFVSHREPWLEQAERVNVVRHWHFRRLECLLSCFYYKTASLYVKGNVSFVSVRRRRWGRGRIGIGVRWSTGGSIWLSVASPLKNTSVYFFAFQQAKLSRSVSSTCRRRQVISAPS